MKIKSILVSMLAVVALASCSKDDATGVTSDVQKGDNAYLSIALNAAAPGTFAESGPVDKDGAAVESKASSVVVVGFKDESVKGVYELTSAEQGTIGQGTGNSTSGDAFKVSKDINKIFVIINPTGEVLSQVKAASTYAAMNQVITTDIADMWVDNKFMMTSAGSVADDKGLISVTPTLADSESASDIASAMAIAKAASYTVKVDRTAAKVTLGDISNTNAPTVENGAASITGWMLNTTNKSFLPYAELVDYTLDGLATAAPAKYRQDANFDYVAATYATDFNWYGNPDTYTWKAAATDEYCPENTMSAAGQNYNNTTKMLIKAQFAPAGVTLGKSWFRVGGIIKTFAELDTDYSALVAGTKVDATYKAGLESFLDAVLGTDRTIGWTDEGKATVVTLDDLDAVANGGYLAAKATPKCIVEYFQNSVCYYDVNLKHDNRVQSKLLGRWGVVRNNWYTVKITKISQPGTPYIPDPTDPDITDPENPDPTDPDPDDETSAYISVTIEVNPWTIWTQETELK